MEIIKEEHRGRKMTRRIDKCIFCGAHGTNVKLTDEHIIPYSLGADIYLGKATCTICQPITRNFEHHVARNIYGQFRIHANVQTRHPKQRPDTLPSLIMRNGVEHRMTLPIKDHPYFLILPIWDAPRFLYNEKPNSQFSTLSTHLYYFIPDNIKHTLNLGEDERAEIKPEFRIDVSQFARFLAKIAYCQAVSLFGLDGFDKFENPSLCDIILGKSDLVPYYVGADLSPPPPPNPAGQQHQVEIFDFTKIEFSADKQSRILWAKIRLFADSGTSKHGTPIYTVVIGSPNSQTSRNSH